MEFHQNRITGDSNESEEKRPELTPSPHMRLWFHLNEPILKRDLAPGPVTMFLISLSTLSFRGSLLDSFYV